ncbi:hypothetical protein GTW20_18280 [Nocardiopsis alba]|uniref:Uncharacterized protein n=1 Tax=Nocardiopsis alba TaxID=53437 RepID=A0A7K2IVZ1_9ACTN|nr:hypothetical protein [Nocardiopsis alba]MYR34149.1 hypothetical protein [Nocardiopsis alba]
METASGRVERLVVEGDVPALFREAAIPQPETIEHGEPPGQPLLAEHHHR